jgi:hypothetical protein
MVARVAEHGRQAVVRRHDTKATGTLQAPYSITQLAGYFPIAMSPDLPVQVVGNGPDDFYYDDGTTTDLPLIPTAVNDAGVVVGTSNEQPVMWDNGTLSSLGPTGYFGQASGISGGGTMVGWTSSTRTSATTPWKWTETNTTGQSLTAPDNAAADTYPDAMSGNGTAAGFVDMSATCDSVTLLAEWTAKEGLSEPGPTASCAGWSGHLTVNDGGEIAGTYTNCPDTFPPCYDNAEADGAAVSPGGPLPVLPGTIPINFDNAGGKGSQANSAALGINDSGQVVGQDMLTGSQGQGATEAAVLWQAGGVVNLNKYIPADSGWVLSSANAINDVGDIAGTGEYNGVQAGFLLTVNQPSLSISDPVLVEPDAGQTEQAKFTVSLSQAWALPVSVTVSTKNGSATAPTDYTSTSKVLTFSPGQTSKTFSVTVNGGGFTTGKESFYAVLSDAQGADLGTDQAAATLASISVTALVVDAGRCLDPSVTCAGPAVGGDDMRIFGSGFTDVKDVLFVPQDGGKAAAVPAQALSDTLIDVVTPNMTYDVDDAGRGRAGNTNLGVDVIVEVSDGQGGVVDSAKTSADVYSFDVPEVTGVTPSNGVDTGGEPLTITGKYLSGANDVSFNTTSGAVVIYTFPAGSVVNDTTIKFPAPDLTQTSIEKEIAQTVDKGKTLTLGIAVDVPVQGKPSYDELSSSADGNLTLVPFALTSVSPDSGPVVPVATPSITIRGTGFVLLRDPADSSDTVVFDYTAANGKDESLDSPKVRVVSDTMITATVPSFASEMLAQDLAGKTPLDLATDVRVQESISSVQQETPVVNADKYTVQGPTVDTAAVAGAKPCCKNIVHGPGGTIDVTGTGLSSLSDFQLLLSGVPVADNKGQRRFAVSANPSDDSASFVMPNLSDVASQNGGTIKVDVEAEVRVGVSYIASLPPMPVIVWETSSSATQLGDLLYWKAERSRMAAGLWWAAGSLPARAARSGVSDAGGGLQS